MNNISLIGNITAELTLKSVKVQAKTMPVLNFTIAVNNPFKKNENGESAVNFIPCSAFGKTAELIAHNFYKGAKIGISGRLEITQSKSTKDNHTYTNTNVIVSEVTFCEKQSS